MDSLRRSLEGVDAQALALDGQLTALGVAIDGIAKDASEAGAAAVAAFHLADQAAEDLRDGIAAAEQAVAELERGTGELGVAEAAVTKATDLLAAAQWRLRDALELARAAGADMTSVDADLAQAEAEAAAAARVEASAIGDAVTEKVKEAAAATAAASADKGLAGASLLAAAAQRALAEASDDAGRAISFQMGDLEAWGAEISDLRRYIEDLTGAAKDIQAVGEESASWFSDKDVTALNAAISGLSGSMRRLYADSEGAVTEVSAIGKASLLSASQLTAINDGMRDFGAAADEADAVLRRVYVDSEGVVQVVAAAGDAALLSAGKITALNAAIKDFGTTAAESQGDLGNAAKGVTDVGKAASTASRFFWLTGNQWHWLIAGSVEFLAVAVPAMIALGAAAADAAQGAQMVDEHMTALWTAAEATGNMFHETAGQALGFKDSLQQAQDAANGQVYEALGGILDAVGGKMTAFQAGSTKALSNIGTGFRGVTSAGNQLLNVFDGFVAKMQIDLVSGAGNEIHGLLSHMVTDATQLGEVFGNLGHIILTLASDMPGLAEKLLSVAAGITDVVNWAVNLGSASHYVILMAMAIEEAGRWGQLLVNILGKVGLATQVFSKEEFASASFFQKIGMGVSNLAATIGGILPKLVGGITTLVGQGVSALGRFIPAADGVGTAIEDMGARITAVAADPVLMGWVGLAIAALAGLAIAFDKNRTAVQSWADSVNQAVASATPAQALATLSNALVQVRDGIAENEAKLRSYSPAMQNFAQNANGVTKVLPGVSEGMDKVSIAAGKMVGHFLSGQAGFQTIGHWLTNLENARGAALALDVLTRSQQQWVEQSQNVAVRAAQLAHAYGTTFTGALELAAQAGVKLQDNLTKTGQLTFQQRVRIGDYTQSLLDMGQVTGEVGADMNALAIQSGLQASKVSELNQAWDQFMQNLTGGTAGLSSFETSLTNMGTKVASAKESLGTYAGQINLTVSAFANSLKSYTGKGAAAWQNFDQVVGQTAPQMIDWFRTAGAEGAVSGKQFTSAVQGMVAQLVPFASRSKAAQAELVGLAQQANSSVTSWKALTSWVKSDHESMGQWQDGVTKATEKMAQMGQVAQSLGNVMGSQLTSSLDGAKVSASGLTEEAQSLTQGLQNTSTPASVLIDRAIKMRGTLTELAGTKSAADEYLRAWLNSFGSVGRALYALLTNAQTNGPKIPQSLKDAATHGGPSVADAYAHMARSVSSAFDSVNLPGHMQQKGQESSSQFLHGLDSKTTEIDNWAKTVNTSVKGELQHLPPAATAAGKDAGAGLAQGLNSEQGAVQAAAAKLASEASAAMKHALQSHSPSRVTMAIGRDAGQGFIVGLTGTIPQIKAAVRKIVDEVHKDLFSGLSGWAWAKAKISDPLLQMIQGDNARLQVLANQRDRIMKQIKAAEQYAKSTASSLIGATGLAGVQQPTDPKTGATLPWTVQSIQSQMGTQLKQLQAFDHNIDVLKKMGLNKTLLNQIIQAGYQQGGALAQALAHGSASQIKSLNATEEAIIKASKKIGKDAANAMYDTGKNAGKGFLSGLKSEEKEIEKEMEKIARDMIKAIEKALKIKSPSQEMYDRGVWAAQGLAKGLLDGEPVVLAAAKKLAAAVGGVKVALPKPPTVQPGGPVIQVGTLPPLGVAQPMVVVHQHIAGSVLSEQQLQQHTQRAVLQYAHRNTGNGLFLAGRASGAPVR